MDQTDLTIEHNVAAHRFEVRFPEGFAMLKYHYDPLGRLKSDGVWLFAVRRLFVDWLEERVLS